MRTVGLGSRPASKLIRNITPTAAATISMGMRNSRTMSLTEGGSIWVDSTGALCFFANQAFPAHKSAPLAAVPTS